MKISNFSENDVGVYTCIASNVMGRANSTIRLYGKFLTCWLSLALRERKLELGRDTTDEHCEATWNYWIISICANLINFNYLTFYNVPFFHRPSMHQTHKLCRNQNSHDDNDNDHRKAHNDDGANNFHSKDDKRLIKEFLLISSDLAK